MSGPDSGQIGRTADGPLAGPQTRPGGDGRTGGGRSSGRGGERSAGSEVGQASGSDGPLVGRSDGRTGERLRTADGRTAERIRPESAQTGPVDGRTGQIRAEIAALSPSESELAEMSGPDFGQIGRADGPADGRNVRLSDRRTEYRRKPAKTRAETRTPTARIAVAGSDRLIRSPLTRPIRSVYNGLSAEDGRSSIMV